MDGRAELLAEPERWALEGLDDAIERGVVAHEDAEEKPLLGDAQPWQEGALDFASFDDPGEDGRSALPACLGLRDEPAADCGARFEALADLDDLEPADLEEALEPRRAACFPAGLEEAAEAGRAAFFPAGLDEAADAGREAFFDPAASDEPAELRREGLRLEESLDLDGESSLLVDCCATAGGGALSASSSLLSRGGGWGGASSARVALTWPQAAAKARTPLPCRSLTLKLAWHEIRASTTTEQFLKTATCRSVWPSSSFSSMSHAPASSSCRTEASSDRTANNNGVWPSKLFAAMFALT